MKIRGNLLRILFGINLLFFVYSMFSPLAHGTYGRWYYSFQRVTYPPGTRENLLIPWNFWDSPEDRVVLWDFWFSWGMYYYGFTYELISIFVFQLLTVFSGILVMARRWQKTTSMLVPCAFSILSVLVGLLLVDRLHSILYIDFTAGLPFAMFSTLFFWLLFFFRYALESIKHKRVSDSKIKNFMLRKIWRIPLFVLMISTLGVSIIAVAVNYALRATLTPPVVLGTGHLIDGYHVVYERNLEAGWTAQMFRLNHDGSFMLDLRCDYIAENPKVSKIYYSAYGNISTLELKLEYTTSVVLLQVGTTYEWEPWGDFVHGDVTGILPNAPKFTDSKSCLFEYRGNFSPEVDVKKVMTQAYALEVRLSWIRVFREKDNGTLYYQWLQGTSSGWESEKLEVDKTYSNVSGRFGVYYPIPEEVTSPLSPYEFNYVEWIKKNALQKVP